MPWVKLDDRFAEHPKVVVAGPVATMMWVLGLAYCNRNRTDGFIPAKVVARLADWGECVADPEALAAKLVAVGLWETADDGYQAHDYAHYQPTKAALEHDSRRKKNSRTHANNVFGGIPADVQWNSGGHPADIPRTSGPNPYPVSIESKDLARSASDPELVLESESRSTPKRKTSDRLESERFIEFYEKIWPRRVGRDDAHRAWLSALKRHRDWDEERLCDAAADWANYMEDQGVEPEYVPYPASWLNKGTYRDTPPPITNGDARGKR